MSPAGDVAAEMAPRRLAYADPPYPDLAGRYYGDHPDFGGEVDHAALVEQLVEFDGWALSTSARALPDVLRLCPPGVLVAAWHRGAAEYARSRFALNAWEPVIYVPVPARPPADVSRRDLAELSRSRRPSSDGFAPGRRDGLGAAEHDTSAVVVHDGSTPAAFHDDGFLEVLHDSSSAEDPHDDGSVTCSRDSSAASRHDDGLGASTRDGSPLDELDDSDSGRGVRVDSLVHGSRPRLTDPARVTGAKPARFCRWLFELIGAEAGDELVDVFPGSGGVERAWRIYAAALREQVGPSDT